MEKHIIYEFAEILGAQQLPLDELVIAIGEFIREHAQSLPPEMVVHPKTILESRFTPATEAFDTGMTSCGSMTNIPAEMLRYIGYNVKLVHGETKKSVDHAWILVFKQETDEWKEFDLTHPEAKVSDSHVIKAFAKNSWEDIRELIEEDYLTFTERKRKREAEHADESHICGE